MAKAALLKTSLDVLYFSGAAQVLRRICGGIGAIFALHHVKPGGGMQRGFAPNARLEMTPAFLDSVINLTRSLGYQPVSLAEAVARIADERASDRPFAVFTLDDGYRDTLVHARPVFRKHQCPFTVFVTPAITDGRCELWWRGLEAAIAGASQIGTSIGGTEVSLVTISDGQKRLAWERLYWPLRAMEQTAQRVWIRAFCARQGIDLEAMCRAEAMNWDELRLLAEDPLCTIGAHSVNHYALARLPQEKAWRELTEAAGRIARELGHRPLYLAYPYGDSDAAGPRDFALAAEAGYRAAVTGRKGLIFSGHKDHLMALPRVELSGEYQKLRYVQVLLSGAAFTLWNGLKRA
ncbi:MAG: polysaccharide deacetylase family protein [Hyphomicrobiales bacterium]